MATLSSEIIVTALLNWPDPGHQCGNSGESRLGVFGHLASAFRDVLLP
jgi:hypothetical protein